MRRMLLWTLAVGMCATGCSSADVAGTAPAAQKASEPEQQIVRAERGLMQAVIVEKGPPIDGTLDSPIWGKCPPLVLGECTSDKPGAMKTTARVLFDATKLYAAWVCHEADMGSIRQNVTERDGQVWQDDCVELFATGDPRAGYFHFTVNPRGTLCDAKSTPAKRDDTGYNADVEVKVTTGKDRWTVTMSVPLKQLGAYVGESQTWIVNLNRTKPGPSSQAAGEWSWAIMGSNDYHQVLDYGRITGVKIPRRDDGVTRTASRPPPPPRFEQGKRAGSVIVYHHFPEMTIPDRGKGIARSIDLNIRNSDALKVAFLARATGGVSQLPLNMSDKRSQDNTTSKAYRRIGEGFRPLVYFCDRFRYNAVVESTVSRNTHYTNIRFHSMAAKDGQGALHLRDFAIYRGEDTDPPAAPTELKAAAGKEGVLLTWKPAADNVGIGLYTISRAGQDGKFVKVGQSHLPEYLDRALPNGTYSYRVLGVDFQDNIGRWSSIASLTYKGGFPVAAREASPLEQDRLAYADHVRKVASAGAGKVNRGVAMCFGDSLTGATNYPLSAEAAMGRYRVVAFGRAGWRTDGGRRVIEGDLEKTNPQFCLILYGTNNSKGDQAITAAMDDMLFIAKACEKRGTIPVIGTIPPRGFNKTSDGEASYNAALIAMCKENKIPISYQFRKLMKADRRQVLAGDGVHFVTGGWDIVGPAWAETVDQINFVLLDKP